MGQFPAVVYSIGQAKTWLILPVKMQQATLSLLLRYIYNEKKGKPMMPVPWGPYTTLQKGWQWKKKDCDYSMSCQKVYCWRASIRGEEERMPCTHYKWKVMTAKHPMPTND